LSHHYSHEGTVTKPGNRGIEQALLRGLGQNRASPSFPLSRESDTRELLIQKIWQDGKLAMPGRITLDGNQPRPYAKSLKLIWDGQILSRIAAQSNIAGKVSLVRPIISTKYSKVVSPSRLQALGSERKAAMRCYHA
jgi:hypothetical protein